MMVRLSRTTIDRKLPTGKDRRPWAGVGGLVAALVLIGSAVATAQEFPVFGPRNLGMGRAGVASVNDLSAVYLNPAALAHNRFTRVTLPDIGVGVFTPVDIEDTLDIIDDITRAYNAGPTEWQTIPDNIRRLGDDNKVEVNAHAMLAAELPMNLAFSYTERAIGNLYIDVDTQRLNTINPASPDFITNNQTRGIGDLLWLRQAGVSWATPLPFFDENILVGATGLAGYATSYSLNETILSLAQKSATIDWYDEIRSNKETGFYGDLVLGAQAHLFDRKLVVGITGNHLLRPRIKRFGGDDIRLDPQARVGIAFSPFLKEHQASSPAEEQDKDKEVEKHRSARSHIDAVDNPLTLTLDFDLTKNESILDDGIDSRQIGGGVEYRPATWAALWAGVYANLEERDLGEVITLGARLGVFELAGAYSTSNANGYANEMRLGLAVNFSF